MEAISKALLTIHVITGFSSIVLFWVPMFVKKGGDIHRKVGKIYVFLMWVVVLTAAILSVENFFDGNRQMATFLGFLSLITANPIWYGIAILKHKKSLPPSLKRNHQLFNLVIFVFGIVLLGYGIYLGGKDAGILMIIFGILGISVGKDIWVSYKNTTNESDWLKEHIVGMLTSAIAAYTAFLVFGSFNFIGKYLSGYLVIIPWVAPGVIGTFLIRYYLKNYTKEKTAKA